MSFYNNTKEVWDGVSDNLARTQDGVFLSDPPLVAAINARVSMEILALGTGHGRFESLYLLNRMLR